MSWKVNLWVSWDLQVQVKRLSTFVGTFIARVSRGRTIREFVLGVMAVPVVFSALWFAIFGIAGIDLDNAYSGALYQIILDQEYYTFFWLVVAVCAVC